MDNINNSLIYKENEENVKKEFTENKHKKIQTKELVDPKNLEMHEL